MFKLKTTCLPGNKKYKGKSSSQLPNGWSRGLSYLGNPFDRSGDSANCEESYMFV